MTIKAESAVLPAALPWALIGAACLGSFAATSSGTTRAPFLLDMAHDLDVSMPLVANLVSLTSISWGLTSALGGWLSDVVGRRPLLVGALFALALSVLAQALAGSFFWIAVWATVGGGCSGAFMGVVFAEVSGRVPDSQRGRALGWVMSGQSLTLVIGVPMAAAVGSLIGWRGWLLCVGGLAFAASLSLFATVGRGTAGHMRGDVRPSLRTALSPKRAGPARHRHRRTDLLRAGGGLFRHLPAGDLSPLPGRDRHSVGRVRAGQCRRDHPGRPARRPAARSAVDLCHRHGAVGRGCPRAFHVASQPRRSRWRWVSSMSS